MLAAPCHPDEDRRQKALDEQDILDTPPSSTSTPWCA